jgi:starch-binding outer membrane protein SusE/F
MRSIKNLFLFIISAVVFFAACSKVKDLPYYEKGTAVTLTASSNAVAPALADSTKEVISFNWTNPNYATDSSTVKYVLQIDSVGRNFTQKTEKVITGNRAVAFTGRELNSIILNYGFALGVPHSMEARVVSSYANNNDQYTSNTVNFSITPFTDPSVLTSTATTVTGTLATAANNALTFSWTRSFAGYSGVVNYAIQYDSAGKNFASPQLIQIGTGLTRQMTIGEINQAALNEGVAGGSQGRIEYRVRATTAQGAVAFSNTVSVLVNTYQPIIRLYMPGSYQGSTGQGNDWDPGTAPQFIRDQRAGQLNRLYYMYIYLPANTEFKITQGNTWAVNFGGSGGTLSASGPNLSVATAGVYRVSVNLTSMTYDIREGRMGFVGGATGADWNPGNVFPNYALGYSAPNLFVGVTQFTNGGWKLIDNNQWNDGSNSITETRSYGSAGGNNSTLIVNGDNMPDITTPGRYRIIWDGRNPDNVRYQIMSAPEMRVVGDGIQGVPEWNPGASPQMTYAGNGVWQVTLTLIAGKDIKFLSGNDWGAFDYEDASGGSTATGTPRRIQFENGPNFKTPTTTGSYTITLNERTQTVTIQ